MIATSHSHQQKVVVVGGGLAGIAAAVRLAEHGQPVTLVETRKRLGGRATSFTDPTTGDTLDNCQHVLMRCCTNLIDLYQRLGVDRLIDWHRTLYFTNSQGELDTLEGDDLPAPLHLTRGLLGFKTLSLAEKFAISRGMLAIMQTSRRSRENLATESFAHWLARHRQPASVIEKFWGVIIISACNASLDDVSASYALQVFQEGFLYDNTGYEMGLAKVPLVDLYASAQRKLESAGGELMLGSSAQQFLYDHRKSRISLLKLADRQELAAGDFISTVPFDRLAKLACNDLLEADSRLSHLEKFSVSPIIGIHLVFDAPAGKPVMDLPHLVLMQSPVQWLFNKGMQQVATDSGDGQAQQHLHAVISAAYDLVDKPADDLIAMASAEVRKALPGACDAKLVHARAVKEKRATFAISPGIDRYRPATTGAVENLYLAGDWVNTGWPATMEGAVRSGYRAAAAILRKRGHTNVDDLAPDLQPSPLYRLLSG